jgi:hypothetical protein
MKKPQGPIVTKDEEGRSTHLVSAKKKKPHPELVEGRTALLQLAGH